MYGFEINRMFSGYYIVDSLTYKYKKNVNKDGFSQFSTVMTLKRKEWPTNICVRILCDDGKVIIFNDNTMHNVSGIKEVKNA